LPSRPQCGALPERGQRCYYGPADVAGSIEYVHWRQWQNEIDDPSNLRNTPVLLFNGRNDYEVYTEVMKDTLRQLRVFVAPERLAARFGTGAAHVWSLDHGSCRCGACSMFVASLECCDVNNCKYDLSGDMLTHTYGPLMPRKAAKPWLRVVDQWRYMPRSGSWRSAGLERWGLAYVPAGCEGATQSCHVHIHYHGCLRRDWYRRFLWVSSLDLNEYGEANDIVIVYPQAAGDSTAGVGCWNWGFAKDDPVFDTRGSVQLRTVARLLDDLDAALAGGFRAPLGGPLPPQLLGPGGNGTSAPPSSSAPRWSGGAQASPVPALLRGRGDGALQSVDSEDAVLV